METITPTPENQNDLDVTTMEPQQMGTRSVTRAGTKTAAAVNKSLVSTNSVFVGSHTRTFSLPVMPLTVLVTLPIPVMSDACTGRVRPFVLRPFKLMLYAVYLFDEPV